MTDILQDLAEEMVRLEMAPLTSQTESDFDLHAYALLARAVDEIKRLRKANSDMGWQLNPDRSGGQFTEEEIKRATEWL